MVDVVLTESFNRLLSEAAPLSARVAAEKTGNADQIWAAVRDSGYADALVPETLGGAGLSLDDVAPLLLNSAERCLPLPLGETMVGRALARLAGFELPADRPIIFWPADNRGALLSILPPVAIGDGFVLRQIGERLSLIDLATRSARDGFGFLTADIAAEPEHYGFEAAPGAIFLWAAAFNVFSMAGLINRLVGMTVQYANERSQFSKPLSKFQAIQHQISILAEQSVMASAGARLAFKQGTVSEGLVGWHVAAACSVAGDAATTASAIAHAVHGAIGISQEHELQTVTRRLKRARLCFGSRDYWSEQVGLARLDADAKSVVDFIRTARAGEI